MNRKIKYVRPAVKLVLEKGYDPTSPCPATPSDLSRWYRQINRRYFKGKLLTPALLRFAQYPDEDDHTASGSSWINEAGRPCILIEEAMRPWTRTVALTLLHEMIHVYGMLNNWPDSEDECTSSVNNKFARLLTYITRREPYLRG